MNFLIISCSLNGESYSKIIAQSLHNSLLAELNKNQFLSENSSVEFLDLATIELPFCDGDKCYQYPNVKIVKEKLTQADGVVFAVPVYNYDVNSAAKNLVELAGRSLTDKPVGFVCAAGGFGSYMSVMPFANSLMLDFRCIVLPRFVYAVESDIDENKNITNEKVVMRITELAQSLIKITHGLKTSP